MTNEEVIERLGYIKQQYNILLGTNIYDEVIDATIKALKDNARSQGKYKCVTCKYSSCEITEKPCRECSRSWVDLYEEADMEEDAK